MSDSQDPNATSGDALEQSSDSLLDQAELMIWALLDNEIEDHDAEKLEKLLSENDEVRQRYIECVQLHVDLTEQFQPTPRTEQVVANGPSILTKLMSEHLPSAPSTPRLQD